MKAFPPKGFPSKSEGPLLNQTVTFWNPKVSLQFKSPRRTCPRASRARRARRPRTRAARSAPLRRYGRRHKFNTCLSMLQLHSSWYYFFPPAPSHRHPDDGQFSMGLKQPKPLNKVLDGSKSLIFVKSLCVSYDWFPINSLKCRFNVWLTSSICLPWIHDWVEFVFNLPWIQNLHVSSYRQFEKTVEWQDCEMVVYVCIHIYIYIYM